MHRTPQTPPARAPGRGSDPDHAGGQTPAASSLLGVQPLRSSRQPRNGDRDEEHPHHHSPLSDEEIRPPEAGAVSLRISKPAVTTSAHGHLRPHRGINRITKDVRIFLNNTALPAEHN